MINNPMALLILPHLEIQNANTISSPLTWGFPAVSAFLGFSHALERKIKTQAKYDDYKFDGVGIICHEFNPQVARANPRRDGVFCLTRNPIDKDGETAPLVEEGRAHMNVSLILQVSGQGCDGNENERQQIANDLFQVAQTLRLAGGSIFPAGFNDQENKHQPKLIEWLGSDDEKITFHKKYIRPLLPGFLLISREDLLEERTRELQLKNPNVTALDALLEFAAINYEPVNVELEAIETEWEIRKNPGWIVPIPVGYDAISKLYEPNIVINTRDNNYPFQFVESVYSLGQWVSLHRIRHLNDIFWRYEFNNENNTYRYSNNPKNFINSI